MAVERTAVTNMETFRIREVPRERLNAKRRRWLPLLREAFPAADVIEVGSTAVDGVIGKQDLDILVRVPAAAFPAARTVLDRLLPRDPQQFSAEDFAGYRPPGDHDVAVQLTVAGGPHDHFETFANILRNSADLRAAYNALKREWDGRSMQDYRAAKAGFIKAALEAATGPSASRS